jgi:predicted nucleic acid-binding protein
MNGSNLLVDTNILIYFLQNDLEIIEMIRDKNLTVSFVSELELLSLSDFTEEDESVIKGLLNNCTIWKEFNVVGC